MNKQKNVKPETMPSFKRLIYFIPLFVVAVSCYTDDTCRQSRTVQAGMGFYLRTNHEQTNQPVVSALSIDSLWVNGIGIDSLLYNNKKSVSSVQLPLNLFAGESRFRVVFNTVTDTITVKHTNANHFLSMECGYVRVHRIDTAFSTNHFVDSVVVVNETVNMVYVENIQIHHSR